MDSEDRSNSFPTDADDDSWFEKNVDVGQSTSSLTESTDHDELSAEFNQDELNPELTQSDEHSELTNDDDLLTDKIVNQDPDVSDLQSNNEITSSDINLQHEEESEADDKTQSQSERLELERELLEESNLSLEGKKDDITKELTDIFFQTVRNDLSEEESKDLKSSTLEKKEKVTVSDNLLSSGLEAEGDITEDTLKNELTDILEDKLLNPDMESKTLDVVQELQEHIKLADSQAEKSDIISMEPNDIQKSLDKICSVTKDIEENFDSEKEEEKEADLFPKDKSLENETEEEISDKVNVNTIEGELLSKESGMVEVTHGDDSRAKIKVKKDSESEETPSKFVVSDTKQPELNAETIVMETEEGQQIVFNAEVIATENSSIMNVEGGAEFLEAVTGNLDVLLEQEEEQVPEPEPPVVRKKQEQSKCFISTCKSGKTGFRTSFRYFKPPTTSNIFKKWQKILAQGGEVLSPDSTICELHFKSGHIYKKGVDEAGTVIWGLREGALPTIHNAALSKTLYKTVNIPRKTEASEKVTPNVGNKNVTFFNSEATSGHSKESPARIPKQKAVRTAAKVDMNDPEYLNQNPNVIRNALDEVLSLDVLVCGKCRAVFYFTEELIDHKRSKCHGKSTFKVNTAEPKEQVWAFLLWKSAQAKVLIADIESPWKLYQRWVKMDENIRESWITAGRALRDITSLGQTKMVDTSSIKTGPYVPPAKPGRPPGSTTKTPPEETYTEENEDRSMKKPKKKRGGNHVKEIVKVHRSASGFVRKDIKSQVRVEDGRGDASDGVPQEDQMDVDSETEQVKAREENLAENNQIDGLEDDVEIKQEVMSEEEEMGDDNQQSVTVRDRLRVRQPLPVINKSAKQNVTKPSSSKKDDDDDNEEEFVVESIVSRRYNPKKKQFEYLLKWEGYPSEQNTWEPAENMATCQHLLKAFEANLVKQQLAKQAAVAKTPVQSRRKLDSESQPGPSGVLSHGRPDRRSKQKALDQVKVWCGSMKPTDDEYGLGIKRKVESDSDFEEEEENPIKKAKLGKENENTENTILHTRTPVGTKKFIRGGMQKIEDKKINPTKPSVNGTEKESNLAAALGLESDSENDSETNITSTDKSQTPVVRKMSSLSVQNQQMLMSNAKGVVKVDPSQVPNLTSGVYIMSNKSGIFKVDDMASKNALTSLQKQGLIKKTPTVSNVSPPPLVMVGNKDEVTSPQKSGIIRRQQPVPILPKPTTPLSGTPTRPLGLLKPGNTPRPLQMLKSPVNSLPRMPKIPQGLSTKIQGAVRPKGALPTPTPSNKPTVPFLKSSPVVRRTPLQPKISVPQKVSPQVKPAAPQKPTIKPIESILGSSMHTSQKQKLLLQEKKAAASPVPSKFEAPIKVKAEEIASKTTPARKFLSQPLVFRNRGRGGLGNRGGLSGRGRGGLGGRGSSLGALLRIDQTKEPVPVKESKLVENDSLLMEFREESDSESEDGGLSDHFPDLNDPIEPTSPPRPLSLCPLTGKILLKAEGEKTPEPTPPPSPKAPTPPLPEVKADPPSSPKFRVEIEGHEPSSILPDDGEEEEETPVMKGMMCKLEMSPGGTNYMTPANVTEGTVTIKRSSSPILRGPQLSVLSGASANTSLGTITVPARKIFHDESGTISTDDDVVTITGEDGLVYQVSNSDVSGNTILMSSGEDGQQQCVYVTAEATEGDGDEPAILTLDTAYADAVAQLGTEQFYIKEDGGGELVTLEGEEGTVVSGDDQGGQVVAQLVEAGEPAPGGGPRRVVLLLPDGNLMMTEVDEEQFAALDLDK